VGNKEPFAHKDWRKEPYEPRPYVELRDYAITSNVPAEVRHSPRAARLACRISACVQEMVHTCHFCAFLQEWSWE
jgi:hypothetical protein